MQAKTAFESMSRFIRRFLPLLPRTPRASSRGARARLAGGARNSFEQLGDERGKGALSLHRILADRAVGEERREAVNGRPEHEDHLVLLDAEATSASPLGDACLEELVRTPAFRVRATVAR